MAKALENAVRAVVTVAAVIFLANIFLPASMVISGSALAQTLAVTAAGAFVNTLLSKPIQNPTVDNFGTKLSRINPIATRRS